MFSRHHPTDNAVATFVADQRSAPFSCPFVGATRDEVAIPSGWAVDRYRVRLGDGAAIFARARSAVAGWAMFRLGWVETWPPDAPATVGTTVAVLVQALGLWTLNACRVVYAVDEADRFGFAYGTLPGHVERGEERFLVWRDPTDDGVWFEVLAVSRPNHWLARLGNPYVRRLQRRFGRDARAAMARAVTAEQ